MNYLLNRLMLVVFLCFVCCSAASANPTIWPPDDATKGRISKATGLLDQIIAMIPDTPSTADALADALDYDFEQAIEFVQTSITYEPYLGLMRGPDGTARIGAGNAWDQAVLLAAIIRSMGGDAQLIRGQLAEQDAQRLLAETFVQVSSPSDSIDMQGLKETLADYDQGFFDYTQQQLDLLAENADGDKLEAQSRQIASLLSGLMKDAGTPLSATGDSDALVNSLAADYVWVRYRDGPGDDWRNLHPAFSGEPPSELTPEKYIDETVPQEYLHRVALQLFIERQTGTGETETLPIMDRYERPAANLSKQMIALGVGPLSFGKDGTSKFVVPMLNGQMPAGALAVTEMGLTADPADLGTGAGEFFATLSSAAAGALGELSEAGGGDSKKGLALVAMLLKVTVIAPGKDDLTIIRKLASLPEADVEFPGSASFNLTMDVGTGVPSEAYTTRKLLSQGKDFVEALPVLMAIGEGQVSYQDASKTAEFKKLGDALWPDYDLISSAMLPADENTRTAYRDGVLLVSRVSVSEPLKGTITVSDIMSNPVTVLTREADNKIQIDPALALQQGVRETLLESDLMMSKDHWSERLPGTLISDAKVFAGNPTVSDWPENAKMAASKDLEDGYVIAPVKNGDPYWWRVDPLSGQSLGMGARGGQDAAEYIVLVIGAGIATYMFKRSVESCDKTYKDNQKMADCCIVGNLMATWGSSAAMGATGGLPTGPAGAYAAYPFTTSAAYIFSALSFETSIAMTADIAASPVIGSICKQYLNSQ